VPAQEASGYSLKSKRREGLKDLATRLGRGSPSQPARPSRRTDQQGSPKAKKGEGLKDHLFVRFNRGWSRRRDSEIAEGAIADYEEALRLKPELPEAFNNRGLARTAKGDLERAIADFDEASSSTRSRPALTFFSCLPPGTIVSNCPARMLSMS
jgi:tetratricopeptide (TPR) repeat protein